MKEETPLSIIISYGIAIVSVFIGTLFFIVFLITQDDAVTIKALFYVFFAFLVNFIAIINLIIRLFTDQKNKKKYKRAILLTLLNVPIAILYFFIVVNIHG